MKDGYKVVEGSVSSHCCFEASVVDTHHPKYGEGAWGVVCECFDLEDTKRICGLLNSAEEMA